MILRGGGPSHLRDLRPRARVARGNRERVAPTSRESVTWDATDERNRRACCLVPLNIHFRGDEARRRYISSGDVTRYKHKVTRGGDTDARLPASFFRSRSSFANAKRRLYPRGNFKIEM